MRLRQKLADSVAANFAIIASKLIHVHTDEFPSLVNIHVSRVRKRMPHRFIPVCQTVIDAFANNFAELTTDRRWNILAHDISAERQRQTSLLFPPLAKIDDFFEA